MPNKPTYSAIKPGDTIGVMAPSSYVERSDIEASQATLEAQGYRTYIHPQTYARYNQSAGTRDEKLAALHSLYADDSVKAIWAAGGGNRALHILDGVDYPLIKNNPKPLIGFSDTTSLLNCIYAQSGTVNIHGPVFKQIHQHKDLGDTLALLRHGGGEIPLDGCDILRAGNATGTLIGGNLSVFQYLAETLPRAFCTNAILFLEDCQEELSRIDRMLLHLRRTGVLSDINALLLGEFTDITDNGRPYGFTLREIVLEHMEGIDAPIIMGMPFGHGANLSPIPIGGQADLNMTKRTLTLYSL